MRDLAPDFATACQAPTVAPSLLVYLDFDGAPLRAWTGIGAMEYDGHTWTGLGSLAAVEPIEEYSEIRSGSLGLTLTQIPNHLLSEAADIGFKRRAAAIYLALFDSAADNLTLIGVELIMRGTMDTMTISRSPESSTIKLTLANELARLRDSWGSLYTDPHQRTLSPGDSSLRFVAALQDLQIRI